MRFASRPRRHGQCERVCGCDREHNDYDWHGAADHHIDIRHGTTNNYIDLRHGAANDYVDHRHRAANDYVDHRHRAADHHIDYRHRAADHHINHWHGASNDDVDHEYHTPGHDNDNAVGNHNIHDHNYASAAEGDHVRQRKDDQGGTRRGARTSACWCHSWPLPLGSGSSWQGLELSRG